MQFITKESILQVYETTSVNGAMGTGADLSKWKLVASVKLKGNVYKHCIPVDKVFPSQ